MRTGLFHESVSDLVLYIIPNNIISCFVFIKKGHKIPMELFLSFYCQGAIFSTGLVSD